MGDTTFSNTRGYLTKKENLGSSTTPTTNITAMDPSNLLSQLEQLDDEIDDLEESLEPLLKKAFSETTSKLPLLDKAKLYVLVTYAIESVLFCESTVTMFFLMITN